MANTNLVTRELYDWLLPAGRICYREDCREPITIGSRVYRVAADQVYHVSADCSSPGAAAFAADDPETLGRCGPNCGCPVDRAASAITGETIEID